MSITSLSSSNNRSEFITRGDSTADALLADGVELRLFATGPKGAIGLCTAMATLRPMSTIPYHTHPCVEVITTLIGTAVVQVEGRHYQVHPYDAIFIPAGLAHCVRNEGSAGATRLHVSFDDIAPGRVWVEDSFSVQYLEYSPPSVPERLIRFATADSYQLAENADFRDLFTKRLGSAGVCGGYGNFQPGASLPCHIHEFDESISIVEGEAICQVAGREYALSNYDTACIPRGRPHRFINRSERPMAMIWVYAGDEPDRVVVGQNNCLGDE
jgi:quercetin dioxygenase-like cupin family protein